MGYAFKTELRFSEEARAFVESGDRYGMIGGRWFLKSGPAGIPDDLADCVAALLVLDGEDTFGWGSLEGSWKTACFYESDTLDIVEACSFLAQDRILETADRYRLGSKSLARSKEIDEECRLAARAAAKAAWGRVWGRTTADGDRDSYFGQRERCPLVSSVDLEQWYLRHGTLERDFSEGLHIEPLEGADRLRALYRRDELVGKLEAAIENQEFARLRIVASEWLEIAAAEGDAIKRSCEVNAALLSALDAAGAKTVRAVFDEDGAQVERAIPADDLAREARSGARLSLSRWRFTPALYRDPDMSSFLGVKFRGKWIFKAS